MYHLVINRATDSELGADSNPTWKYLPVNLTPPPWDVRMLSRYCRPR